MYGEGEKSQDGGSVLCNHCAVSCAAAPRRASRDGAGGFRESQSC